MYVYVRDNGGIWTEQQKFIASDGITGDAFGSSVALSGDIALIGAQGVGAGPNEHQGAAYVFARDNGGMWTEQQKLTASDGALGDNFGYSGALDLDADTALIGAEADDIGANNAQGSVYIFKLVGGVWTEQQKLTASDGAAMDVFGYAVALASDGETALIAALGDGIEKNINQGSAYVFIESDLIPTNTPEPTVTDNPTEEPTLDATSTPDEPTVTPTGESTPTATDEPGTTELIANGGFEDSDATPWTVKNGSGDKVKCNKDKDGDGIPDKIVAHAGNCAFQFKNVVGEAGKLEQNLDLSAIIPAVGDGLNLSFFAQSKSGATVKAKVVFKYGDDTKTKISVESSGAEAYTEFTGSETLTSADITKAKISFKSAQTSGKAYVDAVSLTHTSFGLIAVPDARLGSSTH